MFAFSEKKWRRPHKPQPKLVYFAETVIVRDQGCTLIVPDNFSAKEAKEFSDWFHKIYMWKKFKK